ncbi:MAG: adenylate kinase [Thermodesulfobacteriota bacterium]
MNILLFGPNGSGKGTQGAILRERYQIPHIETGVIFRDNISKGTELGKQAKEYIDRGELVPDDITIPMVRDRLRKPDCRSGWLLDGFPRNISQAIMLNDVLTEEGIGVDVLVNIILDRETAKKRIMGRRICVNDNNHPNNVNIEAIKPDGDRCRICGGELRKREDDQDEEAIDQRHNIYYDTEQGTLAAVNYFKDLSAKKGKPEIVEVDGSGSVEEVTGELTGKLSNLNS